MAENIPLNFYKRITTSLSRAGSIIYTTPSDRASIVLNTFTNNNTNDNRYVTVALSGTSQDSLALLNRFPLGQRDIVNITPEKLILSEGDSIFATGDIQDIINLDDPAMFWEFNLPTDITSLEDLTLGFTTGTGVTADFGVTSYRNRIINENFDDWSAPVIGPLPVSAGSINQNTGALNWVQGMLIPATNNPVGTVTVSKETSTPQDLSYIGTPYFARTTHNISSVGTTQLHLLTAQGFGFLATTNQGADTPGAINLLGKQITLSFWARASQPTKVFSEDQVFTDSPAFWTPTIQKIFDLTTDWQQFTHTYTQPTYEQVLSAAYNPGLVNPNSPTYTILTSLPPTSAWSTQVDIKTFWSLGTHIIAGNHPNRPPYIGQAMTLTELSGITNSVILTGYYDIAAIRYTIGDGSGNFTIQLSSGVQTAFTYDPTLETDTNVTLSILETDNRVV